MNQITVGVADCRVSARQEDVIVTHALGSCIAVAVYDAAAKVGGLLHLMLPASSLDEEKARRNPYMFADTGIPLLFHAAYEKGAKRKRLTVYLAGGAQVLDEAGVFNIGRRNYLAVRKIVWEAGLLVGGEAVGGTQSRTVKLEVGAGAFWVRDNGCGEEALLVNGGGACVRTLI